MSGPKDVLNKESHLDKDGEGADEPDEEGAVGLIPNAEVHLFSVICCLLDNEKLSDQTHFVLFQKIYILRLVLSTFVILRIFQ